MDCGKLLAQILIKKRYPSGYPPNHIVICQKLTLPLISGGEAGIRTPAPITRTNGLANRPLRPLGYFSTIIYTKPLLIFSIGGESEIRTHGRLTPTPVFKTGALNQLNHLSTYLATNINYDTQKYTSCQEEISLFKHFLS